MATFPAVPGIAVPGAASPADPGSAAAGAGAVLAGTSTLTAGASPGAGATLAGTSALTAGGGVSAVRVVNQWAATFAQPASFGTTPPALQSTVIALAPATSVGGGSGTPTPGNWLVCIAGWNQAGLAAATVSDADDIHSYWRPGKVSTSSGKTRCSVWYTANLARAAGDVYAAPAGAMAGMACLVIELSGTGPWDVVTGTAAGYAAGATSLNLALPAPSAASFVIAAVCGDSTAAGQAFTPASWTALHTVAASNGSDHSCDAVLTSAILPSTAGSVSVNGTASTAADLAGVIIEFQINAPSPVPGGANPAWPGRVILEAAFGAGFQTPPDEMTWTALSDSAWSRSDGYKRFWSWRDDSGVPYALGQLQSGTGAVDLDNFDGALSPSNSASPFFPDCQPGTPVRLRMALGTLTDGTVVNRWYVWQRNALAWPEKRNKALRNFVPLTLTDCWSAVSGSCTTPYRGEIIQESSLYAWWPADDGPLTGGVQPASLRNAAPGNTATLTITASPAGVSSGDGYTSGGIDATATYPGNPSVPPPSVAVSAVAQLQGWMYGDPQSSPTSYATSNPVTANPGSAAWQQTGGLGAGGSNGWFLAANDPSFPPLSGGTTVKVWFNAAFYKSAQGWHNTTISPPGYYSILGQPYAAITLACLSTGTAPVCLLQLDRDTGHLQLVTYNGATPAVHVVYSASDLRSNSWHCVDVQLTQTTWAVYVNGGLTASASGSVPAMTSAWSWLTLNGDYGTAGGASPAAIQHSGNVAYSHCAVFSGILPAWRLLAHYCAAVTGFGQLPAPQAVSLSTVENEFGTGWTPDGSAFNGVYGYPGGTTINTFTFSALAVAQAGPYTSGPSARAVTAGMGQVTGGIRYGCAVWASWASLAPQTLIYTASSAAAETGAATACGSGDAFTSGFGAGAAGTGVCQTGAGTGAPPPASASSLGDTVAQRVERVLGYGQAVIPSRAVDSTASLLVQAALDAGGQQAGANVQNLVDSDNGLLYVDSGNTLCYRSRPHLAADTPAWHIGMNVIAGMAPFDQTIEWSSDPQRIWDAITVQPYSPDGATLADLTPSNAAAVNAAQRQFGVRPKQVTSYLQDSSKQQAQANWLFASFGALQRRASVVAVDAARHPAAWQLVLGLNPGDLVQVYDAPFGQPATTGTYRASQLSRSVSYGANGGPIEGKLLLMLDPVPASYWS